MASHLSLATLVVALLALPTVARTDQLQDRHRVCIQHRQMVVVSGRVIQKHDDYESGFEDCGVVEAWWAVHVQDQLKQLNQYDQRRKQDALDRKARDLKTLH